MDETKRVATGKKVSSMALKSLEFYFIDLLNLLTSSDVEDLVGRHAKRILETEVKPYFRDARVDDDGIKVKSSGHNPVVVEKGDYSDDGKIYQNQSWKLEKVDCVEIFQWIVMMTKYPHMSELQPLVVPPILILMDDFDPLYKESGIRLLQHALIRQSSLSDIRRTGLGDVFFHVG
jgi:hypothetical protein